MGTFEHILIIFLLILGSSFFSISEIALAASRKIRLQVLASEGYNNAQKVLALQENPGNFFTLIQIGLNAVAILGGILGESAFSPHITHALSLFSAGPWVEPASFFISVFLVTSLYILFADLIPKRFAMIAPETIAMAIVKPMQFLITAFKPLVWFFDSLSNLIFRVLGVSTLRKDDITPGDILAMMDAGAQAGVLQSHERELLGNIFGLESRTAASAMTTREDLIYFMTKESQDDIKSKITKFPHVKFLVVDGVVDRVVGYVDASDLLLQVLNKEEISLKKEGLVKPTLMIPDTLTLYEVLEQFKSAGIDFAVVLNEYALVMGIITLKDVMNIVMGELVSSTEDQIIQRDINSWLVEGSTPLTDVLRVLETIEFPAPESYETIAGFMMYTLRKIPKRTDFVIHGNYKFEVVDIDNYKIDQLLVTRITHPL
ncbi:MAG: HlyC/CorC family transporter [Parachlamydiaceae bacterium]|nr:HlyC/CorC family transporter [Parachlamydiaceae bacterium]